MDNIIVNQIPFTHNEATDEIVTGLVTSTTDYLPAGVNMINAPFMWSNNITGKDVKIAVIDSGCDLTHPDLQKQIIGGRNFSNDDKGDPNKYQDYNGHGTHVCGTIAALRNNVGLIGVAPGAKILVLKALNKAGSGSIQSIIDAINYAISQRVDIISMSLGAPNDIPALHKVIIDAVNKDILVVCAAGNEGDNNAATNEFSYPAAYNEVISVGAIDASRSAARFTDSNKEVDLVGPGVNITSTYLGGKYANLSGTSMATPHITGSLALLLEWSTKEFGRRLSEAELYGQLIKNTNTLPIARTLQGNGMLYMNPIIITK